MTDQPTDHRAHRNAALERYSCHVRALGYTPNEVTLLLIGFTQGWWELQQSLERVARAIKDTRP